MLKHNIRSLFSIISDLIMVIVADLERRQHSTQWTNAGGRYIPFPQHYLKNQKWLEEIPFDLMEFQTDTTGFPIGYCKKCGKSGTYADQSIFSESKCCIARILPERVTNTVNNNQQRNNP